MRSDEQLMASYVGGDQQAFAEIFRRYAPALHGFFRRRGKRTSECQDLVQQTFLHLHRSRLDFRTGEALRPWLYTIARNVMRDHGRRQLRKPEWLVEVDTQHAAPENDSVSHAERARALFAALARLPVKDRGLIDEHYFDERSFEEIAERDGVHSTTLRVRAHRACARLRSFIDPEQAVA